MGDFSLVHEDEDQFSEVKVRVMLTRRAGYAVLNIYLPTVVLLVVSYVTLYIRPAIIDVRMTSALTVQLVIATLYSQVFRRTLLQLSVLTCTTVIILIVCFH